MNLKNIILSERNHTKKGHILCGFVYTKIFGISKSLEAKGRPVVSGAGGSRK